MTTDAAREAMGADLAALVDAWPSRLVGSRRVTGLPAKRLNRATFRLTFADGTRLKGRRLDSAADAERIERLTVALDGRRFSQPIARRGTALLEPWIEGVTLDRLPLDPRLSGECGALLGAVHSVSAELDGEATRWQPAARLTNVHWRLARLAAEGLISRRACIALNRRASETLPDRPSTGLVHRDLWPRNVVVDAAGVAHVVDNGSISLGAHEFDLARTSYLWPMNRAAAKAFRTGYADAAGRQPEPADFWTIDVLSDVALFRRLNGIRGVARPTGMLREMARRA
jgi:Phosphotransferase enzyme family